MRDITLADTFYQLFTTRAFSSGVPTTLGGTPVVSAYENDSLTQITAGITLGVDHDGVTGLNLLTVVASGANGYETGKDYALVITTGTVGGVSVVGEVVAEFTIGRSAAAVDLANGTDGLGAIKTDTAAILADTGTDGVVVASLAAGSITAAVVATGAIDADALAADAVAEIADGVWDEDATAHQTQGTFGQAIGDPVADANTIYGAVVTGATGATIAADIITIDDFLDTEIAAIKTVTDAQGATGSGLTAIPWNASWDAEVQSEVQDALDATLADSVPADGTRPSITQALYMLVQFMTERAVSGTTVTVKKVDGSTSLMTFTLNDATTPTSITRAT